MLTSLAFFMFSMTDSGSRQAGRCKVQNLAEIGVRCSILSVAPSTDSTFRPYLPGRPQPASHVSYGLIYRCIVSFVIQPPLLHLQQDPACFQQSLNSFRTWTKIVEKFQALQLHLEVQLIKHGFLVQAEPSHRRRARQGCQRGIWRDKEFAGGNFNEVFLADLPIPLFRLP